MSNEHDKVPRKSLWKDRVDQYCIAHPQETYSPAVLAKELGTSSYIVWWALRKLNKPVMSRSESQQRQGRIRTDIIDKKVEPFLDQDVGERRISKATGIPPSTVSRSRRRQGRGYGQSNAK